MIDWMLDSLEDGVLGLIVPVLVALVVLALLVAGVNKLGAQSFPARLEAQRISVEHLGCHASEDVIGKAVDFNRTIASAAYWNSGLTSWLAANEEAYAVPIQLPDCRDR